MKFREASPKAEDQKNFSERSAAEFGPPILFLALLLQRTNIFTGISRNIAE
jgi:hypothetical protein